MDTVLSKASIEVQKLTGTVDEPLRRKTIDGLRDLQFALETPEETMLRLIYSVRPIQRIE